MAIVCLVNSIHVQVRYLTCNFREKNSSIAPHRIFTIKANVVYILHRKRGNDCDKLPNKGIDVESERSVHSSNNSLI